MGKSQSKDSKNVPEYKPEFEVIRIIDDPNYGKIKLIRENKGQQQMILKEFVFDTKQAFEEELKFFKSRASFDHPNIVQVIGYNATESQNLCSSLFKVNIFIEILAKELQTELREKTKSKSPYSENEVLVIAHNVIAALSHFQSKSMAHGDVRPVNIFKSGQDYKVTDPKLEIDKNANALTKAIITKSKTFLAPELLVKVPSGKFEFKDDPYKADVFSLGATLLGLSTLTKSEELYNYDNGELNEALLHERLEQVKANYSPFTHDLIRDMLSIDVEHRPDFVSLRDRLAPFEDGIKQRTELPFMKKPVTSPPKQKEAVKKSAAPPANIQHDLEDHYVSQPQPTVQVQQPTVQVQQQAPVTTYSHNDLDDLEAKIRAALDRSHETYRQVSALEAQNKYPGNNVVTQQDYQVNYQNYGTTNLPRQLQPEENVKVIERVAGGEKAVNSAPKQLPPEEERVVVTGEKVKKVAPRQIGPVDDDDDIGTSGAQQQDSGQKIDYPVNYGATVTTTYPWNVNTAPTVTNNYQTYQTSFGTGLPNQTSFGTGLPTYGTTYGTSFPVQTNYGTTSYGTGQSFPSFGASTQTYGITQQTQPQNVEVLNIPKYETAVKQSPPEHSAYNPTIVTTTYTPSYNITGTTLVGETLKSSPTQNVTSTPVVDSHLDIIKRIEEEARKRDQANVQTQPTQQTYQFNTAQYTTSLPQTTQYTTTLPQTTQYTTNLGQPTQYSTTLAQPTYSFTTTNFGQTGTSSSPTINYTQLNQQGGTRTVATDDVMAFTPKTYGTEQMKVNTTVQGNLASHNYTLGGSPLRKSNVVVNQGSPSTSPGKVVQTQSPGYGQGYAQSSSQPPKEFVVPKPISENMGLFGQEEIANYGTKTPTAINYGQTPVAGFGTPGNYGTYGFDKSGGIMGEVSSAVSKYTFTTNNEETGAFQGQLNDSPGHLRQMI